MTQAQYEAKKNLLKAIKRCYGNRIEEDIQGADVMTFACPFHPEVGRLQSRVYG